MTITAEHPTTVATIDPTLRAIHRRLTLALVTASASVGATRSLDTVTVPVVHRGRHVTDVTITREGAATVYTGWDGEKAHRIVDEDAYTLGISNVLDRIGRISTWWAAKHESVDPAAGLVLTREAGLDRAGLLAYSIRYVSDAPGVARAVIGRPDATNEWGPVGVPVTWTAMTAGVYGAPSRYASAIEAAHAAMMQAREDQAYATEHLTGFENRVLDCAAHLFQNPTLDDNHTIHGYVDASPTRFWQALLGLVERDDVRASHVDAVAFVARRRAARR